MKKMHNHHEGKKLNAMGIDEETFLKNYDITAFDRPSLTVDALLLTVGRNESVASGKLPVKTLKVLLIQRSNHPYIGQWALPGGFVGMKESLRAAAYRELFEETGVDNVYLEQLHTFGKVDRDPRGRMVSAAYMALVDMQQIIAKAGTDAADAKWFDISCELINQTAKRDDNKYIMTSEIVITLVHKETVLKATVEVVKQGHGKHVEIERKLVSSDQLAFDHGVMIQMGLEHLRDKVEHTDIVFQLMPEQFTLTELKETCEVVLGRLIEKTDFDQMTDRYVEETEADPQNHVLKSSKLYRYKPFNDSTE